MWFDGGHMAWMGVSWFLSLAVLVLLVWFIARVVSPGAGPGTGGVGQVESPETILKRRYANGEIDREDYQRRLEDIRR